MDGSSISERDNHDEPEAEVDPGRTDTRRLEAFSDGVYAIAVTLLVLDLHVPPVPDVRRQISNEQLLQKLGDLWPNYLAYLISFTFILIMWSNHHHIFTLIRHADRQLLLINGMLLLFTTLLPFPTSILSTYIETPAAGAATFVYSANFFLIAVSYNLLWRYAAYRGRLLDPAYERSHVDAVTRSYSIGLIAYATCVVLAILPVVGPGLSLALSAGLALYFTLTPRAALAAISQKRWHKRDAGSTARRE